MFPLNIQRLNSPLFENTFDTLRRDVDRFVTDLGDMGEQVVGTAAYPVDIWEEDKTIHVEAELPGFSRDEIDVTLEDNVLTIRAERQNETQQTNTGGEGSGKSAKPRRNHLRERRYFRVARRFTLPDSVDDKKVDAKLSDGVLRLTLHKKAEVSPRKIEVK